jgi:ATP synthase protein I
MVGAWSAAVGGLACVLPNALFVGVMHCLAARDAALRGVAFVLGEFAKVGMVVLILLAIAWMHSGVQWGAVVIGLILTLQANFLVFLVKP